MLERVLNIPQVLNIPGFGYTRFLTLLCMEGRWKGDKFTPPVGFFLIIFFFTQAKSLKFSDFMFLSFRHNMAKFH